MTIFSNLAMSLDGKIAPADRSFFPLGTKEDRRRMLALRNTCDALIMGAETLRSYQKACNAPDKMITNVIISSKMDRVDPTWPFFSSPKIRRILAVQNPDKERFPTCEWLEYQGPQALLTALASQGLKNILIEGGGALMWDFAPFIDTFHVTITPRILGGTKAPTLVDGLGFSKDTSLNLQLQDIIQNEDELYLTYKRLRSI